MKVLSKIIFWETASLFSGGFLGGWGRSWGFFEGVCKFLRFFFKVSKQSFQTYSKTYEALFLLI